jgi:exopolyphosphatase / guanosine-5'-triphosphate,3'-diphosphate pyrophosphatase
VVTVAQRSEHIVVVDVGTNAVRLCLARLVRGERFSVVREARAQTRLGGGKSGVLPGRAIAETVDAVDTFLRKARREEPRVIAVATSAVREARNAATLRAALRRRSRIDVRVLSGDEEARLGSLAAMWSLGVRRATVVDLGGGSLQVSRIDGGEISTLASVPLGAVRLTRRFLRTDPPSRLAISVIRREAAKHLVGLVPASDSHTLVGLGGTIRTLGRMYLASSSPRRRELHGLRVPSTAIRALADDIARLSHAKRRRLAGLRADRADIIVAGALVIDELLAIGGYRALTVCARGVRHGVLIEETFGTGA